MLYRLFQFVLVDNLHVELPDESGSREVALLDHEGFTALVVTAAEDPRGVNLVFAVVPRKLVVESVPPLHSCLLNLDNLFRVEMIPGKSSERLLEVSCVLRCSEVDERLAFVCSVEQVHRQVQKILFADEEAVQLAVDKIC